MAYLLSIFLLLQACLVEGGPFQQRSTLSVAFAATPTPKDGASSLHIPPPPPISMPVWSLACPVQVMSKGGNSVEVADDTESLAQQTDSTSMNIVTFATPVSVAPPKLWVVSLYHGTLTKDSFMANQRGVLQLLRPNQKHLVPVLGKHSGREHGFSKREECSSLGFPWCTTAVQDETGQDRGGLPVELLPDCALYLELEMISTVEAGDHLVVLCQVVGTGEWENSKERVKNLGETPQFLTLDPSTALYTAQLRQEGII